MFFCLLFHACNLFYVMLLQKHIIYVNRVLKDSNTVSENLSLLTLFSVSDSQNIGNSKDV